MYIMIRVVDYDNSPRIIMEIWYPNIIDLPIWRLLEIRDPQVTKGFNTKSWPSMTWMIWGYPDLGNLHILYSHHIIM